MRPLTKDVEDLVPAQEYPRPDEEVFAQKLITLLKRQLAETYPTGTTTLRGAQPKHHGCVKAEFMVEPDLPPLKLPSWSLRPNVRHGRGLSCSNS